MIEPYKALNKLFSIWINKIYFMFGLSANIGLFRTSTSEPEIIIRFLLSPYEKILAYASKKKEEMQLL